MRIKVKTFFQKEPEANIVDWAALGVPNPEDDKFVQYEDRSSFITLDTDNFKRFNPVSDGSYTVVEMRDGEFYRLDHPYEIINQVMGYFDVIQYQENLSHVEPVLTQKQRELPIHTVDIQITKPTRNVKTN